MNDEHFVSPWDDPEDPTPAEADFTLLSHEEEIEVWRARAHQLWVAASKTGDLRSAAQALNVAFRGLKDRQSALEAAARAKESSANVPAGETPVTLESIDREIRAAEVWYQEHGYNRQCPECGSRLLSYGNTFDQRGIAINPPPEELAVIQLRGEAKVNDN